jgi:hypothetical protein
MELWEREVPICLTPVPVVENILKLHVKDILKQCKYALSSSSGLKRVSKLTPSLNKMCTLRQSIKIGHCILYGLLF